MIQSLHKLYSFLHLTKDELDGMLNRIDELYQPKSNPKKKFGDYQRDDNGKIKNRDLLIPSYRLKVLQKRISSLLHSTAFPEYMFGSIRGRNHIMNAQQHLEQTYFLTIDLYKFFPNIDHHQVFKTLKQNGFAPKIARILTKLTTYRSSLPQGAPSSPAIANLVFQSAAKELNNLARANDLIFSTFLDDLSFSSKTCFRTLTNDILNIIKSNGFCPANNKIHYRKNCCEITGLIVQGTQLRLIPEMKQRAKNNQQLRAYVKSIEKANRTRTTIF